MAIFLEDNNVLIEGDSVTLAEEVNVETFAFNEALANSEVEWGNIVIASMKEEYATLNEGAGEAIKNFFKRIIEWVKTLFNKIKNWVKTTLHKLFSVLYKISQFAKTNKSKIMKAADNKKFTQSKITVAYLTDFNSHWISIKDSIKDAQGIDVYRNLTGNDGSIDSMSDKDFAKAKEAIKKMEQTFATAAKRDVAPNKSLLALSVTTAINADKYVTELKNQVGYTQKSLKDTDVVAKRGYKLADSNKEADIKKEKKATERSKFKTTCLNKMLSFAVRSATNAAKEAHIINKKALSVSGLNDSTKKLDKMTSKMDADEAKLRG